MKPHLPSWNEAIDLRGLRYNVRHWGDPAAPRLFLLHGWMDSSSTFQFVVDALGAAWHVIAPDWRGYGASQWLAHPYWFPDYYADLDALLDHYSPDEAARLVGHSMGANIASIYAAVRPQRVAQLVMLDFLGLKPATSVSAADQLGKWLAAIGEPPKLSAYADHAALALRLQKANPRLCAERAAFLAANVSRARSDGQVEMACDPWHKIPSPTPYSVEDALASWRQIVAPVLMVVADKGYVLHRFGSDPREYHRRLNAFANAQVVTIADAGHNLQHDQPEAVAAALERFLTRD